MSAEQQDRCDACGRRGVPLHGLDLLDGGATFRVCARCEDDALITCGAIRLFTLGADGEEGS